LLPYEIEDEEIDESEELATESRSATQSDARTDAAKSSGVVSSMSGSKSSRAKNRGLRYMCKRDHRNYLRDKVYVNKCAMQKVSCNTGILNLITISEPCFCRVNTLSFKNLYVGDRGVASVIEVLNENHYLKCVNLAGNGIHQEGCARLAGCFADPDMHAELRAVDLSNNPLCQVSVEPLLRLVSTKRNVILIGMAGTSIPMESREQLLRRCIQNAEALQAVSEVEEALQLADHGTSSFTDEFGDRHAFAVVKSWKDKAELTRRKRASVTAMDSDDLPVQDRDAGAAATQRPSGSPVLETHPEEEDEDVQSPRTNARETPTPTGVGKSGSPPQPSPQTGRSSLAPR
jgi:hypothetical protein